MPTLTAGDAERVLRFVADAAHVGGDEPFTEELLVGLQKLVPADSVAYCEQDRVRERLRHEVMIPEEDSADAVEVPYWDISAEHPVCRHHNTGDFRALKLSDFLTLAELHRSHVYAVWFRPWGVEHELNVAIPAPPWHTKTFLFDRGAGRDFTERDKRVLDALQPHLANLWNAARTRRRLAAAIAALEQGPEEDARGVVLLSQSGEIEFASVSARRLFNAYFGHLREDELPAVVDDWRVSRSSTLVRRDGPRRLTIERSGNALVLSETADELGLTVREQQILSWVARGKTNPEIAEILWITPSTVRKHLENVYAKLGVRTRTAAAARFLQVLPE
jgi:DNA-binding CsgD family transcriptional regulator